MQGRRREDLHKGSFHFDAEPGDYWKIMDDDGTPKLVENASNLEGTCWYVVAPGSADRLGRLIGRLEFHTVREHDDGTITVAPNDGSSNSILITGGDGTRWHGYIDHGVWQALPE